MTSSDTIELGEAVKRFCRTEAVAENLINYISANYISKAKLREAIRLAKMPEIYKREITKIVEENSDE